MFDLITSRSTESSPNRVVQPSFPVRSYGRGVKGKPVRMQAVKKLQMLSCIGHVQNLVADASHETAPLDLRSRYRGD